MSCVRWLYGEHEMVICSSMMEPFAPPASQGKCDDFIWAPIDVQLAQHVMDAFRDWGQCQHDQIRNLLVGEGEFNVWRLSDHQVLEQAVFKLASGQWRLYEKALATDDHVRREFTAHVPITSGAGTQQTLNARRSEWTIASPKSSPESAPVRQHGLPSTQHWIEIELIGEDDKPIPFEIYQLAFPSGVRIEGRLDSTGFARHDQLMEVGEYKVSFPRLDQGAWQVLRSMPARRT